MLWGQSVSGAVGEFRLLRRDTGIYLGRGGTIGWLVNADAVVVIDSQFPDTAADFLARLPGRAGRNLNLLVNTHHHPDHIGGNAVLRPAAPMIMAHANVEGLLCAQEEVSGEQIDPALVPNGATTGGLRLGYGSETVRLDYFGPGHTGGDLIVTLEEANVVHLGDLCCNRRYARIDRPGGGRVRNWITLLERVVRDWPADTLFICGHAGAGRDVVMGASDVRLFRDYLAGVLEHVERAISAGHSRAEIATLENLPGFPEFHVPGPNRLAGNLEAVFDELTDG